MKKYTQEEFDTIYRDEYGIKYCPSGDYSAVKYIGNNCDFGDDCIFCDNCRFGHSCIFGNSCRFGHSCIFGNYCRFWYDCRFCDDCIFGNGCSFGDRCRFCIDCVFGHVYRFGKDCIFENISKYVGEYPFFSFTGCGSRKGSVTYVFNLESGIYVRCGCFLGTKDQFVERVKTEKGDPMYLDFLDLAVKKLQR